MAENDLVKRLMWSGLVAGLGLAVTFVVERIAEGVWKRVMGEEPPR